jgi:hypothetical protein
MAINPRWKTGRRRQYQQRFKAMGLPCALCGKPIDYTLPYYVTDEEGRRHVNMLAFVIDEKIPVSKWQQGGYNSAAECANDYSNLQPAHAICNARKGNKDNFSLQANSRQGQAQQAQQQTKSRKSIALDGKW